MNSSNELLRKLPSVDEVLQCVKNLNSDDNLPYEILLDTVRSEIDYLRNEILQGNTTQSLSAMDIATSAIKKTAKSASYRMRPVINASGVVLHTNLGRAPMSEKVAEHIKEIALSYSNLEYNIETGERGDRCSAVEILLRRLLNAEASIVVNNNAAAVMLILSSLSAGREAIVSRGELVEIGGSFRIPEVMEQGGAILKEIGSTNKTHYSDYEKAIVLDKTALVLKVHTSNYKIEGFTQSVSIGKLNELCKNYELPLVYDLGSGALKDLREAGFYDEPIVDSSVADIICFSGDKLLGGPQAGIIIGRKNTLTR